MWVLRLWISGAGYLLVKHAVVSTCGDSQKRRFKVFAILSLRGNEHAGIKQSGKAVMRQSSKAAMRHQQDRLLMPTCLQAILLCFLRNFGMLP